MSLVIVYYTFLAWLLPSLQPTQLPSCLGRRDKVHKPCLHPIDIPFFSCIASQSPVLTSIQHPRIHIHTHTHTHTRNGNKMKTSFTLVLAALIAALASAEPIPTTTPPQICTKICAFSAEFLDCGDKWVSSSFPRLTLPVVSWTLELRRCGDVMLTYNRLLCSMV